MSLYMPALTDGSGLSANGFPLTNLGTDTTNAFHNGAESKARQTDAYFATNAPNRWHDGVGFLDVSWDDMLSWVSGNENSWQKFVEVNGVCSLKELTQYDYAWMDWQTDINKYNRLVAYFKQLSCGGGVVPFPDMLNFTYPVNQQNIPIIL